MNHELDERSREEMHGRRAALRPGEAGRGRAILPERSEGRVSDRCPCK